MTSLPASKVYDVAVIGGGIIGLATAMALTRGRPLSLVLLEAEAELASHQTGNNSGVIHSGLYYKPGSHKARNCVEGRRRMYEFCRENGIRHERCGKLVVAITEDEVGALRELERRGTANGLEGLRRLGSDQVAEYEPHVLGMCELILPPPGPWSSDLLERPRPPIPRRRLDD